VVAFLRKAVEVLDSCKKLENCGSRKAGDKSLVCACACVRVCGDCFCSNPVHDVIHGEDMYGMGS
jgi:hypothetical protein